MRKLSFAFLLLLAAIFPALAQAPSPVPALPDTERRTAYVLSASTCNCNVNFAIFGEGTDYANWIEVFVNGTRMDQFGNWSITSPSGSIGTLPRPITDAVLTFNTAQTGTVQIVGARRPRRISQFAENRGVAARDLNQVLTDIIAQNRETWDKTNDVTGRAILAPPGETLSLLAAAATRANTVLGFDALGNTALYSPSSAVTSAANVNFLQAGTGAISRTVQAELRDAIKGAQFGMLCDGVNDDSAAALAATNFADSIGGPTVLYPAGICRINNSVFLNKWAVPGTLTVPGMKIKGAGKGITQIDTRVAGGYAFAVNPAWNGAFKALAGMTATTGGSGALGSSAPIGTLGAITPGSLYTNGTYTGVALTGGSGSGATANITVSGAAVTSVTLVNPGTGYTNGNALSAAAASIGGTGSGFSIPVASITYYVQITMNDNLGNEVLVTLPGSASVTGTTGRISITLPATNTGYSYNLYCGTATQPANYCIIGGGNASAINGNQTVNLDAIGTAHAVPANKIATWQNASITELSIINPAATANASGIMLFKAGYATVDKVLMFGLTGNGLDVPNYTGDLDGSFNVSLTNSKFDTIAGTCVNAAGTHLELSNFNVSGTIFNLCGTLPTNYVNAQDYTTSGFTISTISNANPGTVTTAVPHTLLKTDQVYIRGVLGMTLADGWYRACGTVAASTYQLCDLNGQLIDTTALGAYTASSGKSMLAWRPPTVTSNSGALVWMGLIGTFRDLDFTQNKNFSMYFTEAGSSDNATIENVDYENTYGKGLYIAGLAGGTLTNSECLTQIAFGTTISCVQLGTGTNAGGVQNFQIRNVKVRSDAPMMTAFEQFQNTNNTGSFSDTNRVSGTTWQAFDTTSGNLLQRRFDGFTFDPIPGQVQFSISALNVAKLAPIGYGGALPLHLKATGEWVAARIPAAGVTQGGIGGLTANTTYNFFAYNSAATSAPYVIAMEVSTAGAAVDGAGYWVKVGDATRTFVGQATTDGSGNFQTATVQTSQYPVRTSAPIAFSNGAIGCPTCVLISGTPHGDSNYAILSTDRYVYTSAAFTAPRTWTLPAANSLAVGTTIWVQDAQNTVTAANTLTVQRAGADTIDTAATSLVITGAGGGITFTTDGVANWGVPIQTTTTGGTGRGTLTNHGVLVGAGANPVTQLAVGSNGQLLLGATGADPAFATMSQDCTITAAGVTSCTKTNNVSFTPPATSAFAAKADMQTPSSSALVVPPAQTQNHPGVAKFTIRADGLTGAVCTIKESYNIASCVRSGVGTYVLTFTTAFANAFYNVSGTGAKVGTGPSIIANNSTAQFTTSTYTFFCENSSTLAAQDCDIMSVQGFGTQ